MSMRVIMVMNATEIYFQATQEECTKSFDEASACSANKVHHPEIWIGRREETNHGLHASTKREDKDDGGVCEAAR